MSKWFKAFMSIAFATCLMVYTAILGHADDSLAIADAGTGNKPGSPFPDSSQVTTWYTQMQPEDFFIPDQPDVYFLTPSGLNCGIWFWGGFGCEGDIPGLPPGENSIAWYNGNRSVHHGWTAAIQFPPGQAQRLLPPRSYITYNMTTCATTPEGNVFCEHGEFKFLIMQDRTWFKAWDDRQSYVCLSYGSC